ncbi:DM13 domain-containing protein [Mechercharimyces sp. CAU 1602]|uniref:DM13 domain-containing protein n=1 Tax=Mechercharimyces sp. CAU 1602 TaxID=2973933 RepID=UPI0021631434|nr:DM13 domain-containing protein [Mechercharimyces sp. CAU 1602]MCS1350566.1 DM13 domain-containing protein [Mechercharimyces sp. CAU 1602]
MVKMTKNKWILCGLVVVAFLGLWLVFRPETLILDQQVDEEFPHPQSQPSQTSPNERTEEPQILYQGNFQKGDRSHDGKGKATIYQLANGKRMLRFTQFETDNGPDVKIYLVALPEIKKSTDISKDNYISLGKMKGNKGDQNYEIPDHVDLDKFRSVSIWCERFSVNFASASLK